MQETTEIATGVDQMGSQCWEQKRVVGAHRKAGGKWIKQCNFEVNCLRFISEEKEAIKHDCINANFLSSNQVDNDTISGGAGEEEKEKQNWEEIPKEL